MAACGEVPAEHGMQQTVPHRCGLVCVGRYEGQFREGKMHGEGKYTMAHNAEYDNDVHAVRILLEHGADPEKRDIHGHSPVWAARDRGHADVLPLLLSDSLPSSL